MRTFTVAVTAAVVLLVGGVAVLWGLGVVQVDFGNLGRETREARAAREFFNVVQTSGLDEVQTSLAAGADVNATDESGQTPLVYAAGANTDPSVVEELLTAGADVNAQTTVGWTALMVAVRDNPNPEVPLELLQAGADPTLRNDEGKAALDYALDNGVMRRSSVLPVLENLTDKPFDPSWPSGFIPPVEGATFSSRDTHLPGSRRAYRNGYHEGFDFYNGVVRVPITYGTPVVATADGVVSRADHGYVEMTPEEYDGLISDAQNQPVTPQSTLDELRGRQVWIEHPGGFVSRYAHLSNIPDTISVGTRVTAGQVVGFAGNSGTIEGVSGTQDDPHPHYELWRGDETYLGEGLGPDAIYPLVAQVFGEGALPLRRE